MASIHEFIIDQVRPKALEAYGDSLAHKKPADNVCDQTLLSFMFQNYRSSPGGHTGLRLSYWGLLVMNEYFESYSFKHDYFKIPNDFVIKLDKKMIWPYYISKNQIVFYSDSEAAWFRLSNSNLEQFLECI